MGIDRFNFRSTGAFRTASGGITSGIEYHQCQECQRIYEVTLKMIGLGSMSRNAESIERDRLRREESNRLKALFAIPSSRCVCDPDGDVEYLKERDEEKREQDARWAVLRENDAKRKKTEPSTPKPSGLGTTGAAMRAQSAPKDPKNDGNEFIDQLKQLSDLFNAGALTSEQFEAAKNKLLGLQKNC
jgi:hypothetical protein